MHKTRHLAALCGLVVGALVLTSPAHADLTAAEPWQAVDTAADGTQSPAAHSAIIDGSTVDLTWQEGDAAAGTSLETTNLGVAVESGDVVSVSYELRDGASPAAGAVRLFVYDHADGDTFGEAPKQFTAAPSDSPTTGTLSIDVNWTGTIGTAGLVYDTSNGGVDGTVRFTDLTVAEEKVSFVQPKPEPSDEPSEEPSEEPSPEPSEEPSAEPSQSTSAPPPASQGGGLPITGAPIAKLVTAGVVLLVGGALILWFQIYMRRRRVGRLTH